MKIQFFLLLNLLTLTSVGREEHIRLTYSGNDFEIVNENAATFAYPETISGIIAEPQMAKHAKHSAVAPMELQSVSARGITINTVME